MTFTFETNGREYVEKLDRLGLDTDIDEPYVRTVQNALVSLFDCLDVQQAPFPTTEGIMADYEVKGLLSKDAAVLAIRKLPAVVH